MTSVSSLRCHVSTCFRIGSKFRCIRSTPTETQSIRENDFECLASTGVNAPGTMFANSDPSSSSQRAASLAVRGLTPACFVVRPLPQSQPKRLTRRDFLITHTKPKIVGHRTEPSDLLRSHVLANARASSLTPRRISFRSKAANPSCSPSLASAPRL